MGAVRKTVIWSLFLGCLLNSVAYHAFAAPHPASGSSALVAPQKGLFLIPQGFILKTEKTSWQLAAESKDQKLRYSQGKNSTALLSVQTENLKTDMKIEDYAKRWMKDYSLYGFDVLGSKLFNHNGQKALVMDVLQRKQKQQVRQVLFLNNKKVVILTCQEQEKKFNQILADCNQVARSFEWSAENRPNRPTTF